MEEPDDSLNSDINEGISGPVMNFDRRVEMEAANRLINSLNQDVERVGPSAEPLDQRYLVNMQTGPASSQPVTSSILDTEDFHSAGEGYNIQDEEEMRDVENFHGNQGQNFYDYQGQNIHGTQGQNFLANRGQNFHGNQGQNFHGNQGQNFHGNQGHLVTNQNIVATSNNTYKRSGPEGSPAFQQSGRGILPMDNESVVFRPVKTLDFSALDETAATEEIIPHGMNRSVSTPNSKNRSVSFIQEREICGSLGDDEQSRDTSPTNGFFELKTSPTLSTDDNDELNSRVIFSPLKNFENLDDDGLETGRLSMGSPISSPQRNSNAPPMSASDRVNYIPFSNYSASVPDNNPLINSSRLSPLRGTGSSGFVPSGSPQHHQILHSESETGRCTPPQSPAHSLSPNVRPGQHVLRNSPGRLVGDNSAGNQLTSNSDRKEVLVSIPQMNHEVFKESPTDKRRHVHGNSQNLSNDSGITEPTGTLSGVRYSQMSDSDRDEFMSSNRAGQEQGLPSSSAWEIPTNEDAQKLHIRSVQRDQKLKNKQLPDRKPFVSTVRNAPKTGGRGSQRGTKTEQNSGNGGHIQTHSQRNRVVGAETRQISGSSCNPKDVSQESQRGQRSNVNDPDKRMGSGHGRQLVNNVTNGERVNDKNSRQNAPAVPQNVTDSKNQGYNMYENRSLRQREETQGEASDGQRNIPVAHHTSPTHPGQRNFPAADHISPTHPGLNVVTQVEQYGPVVMEEHIDLHYDYDMIRSERNLDVQGMEEVRSQLQSMLTMSFDAETGSYKAHNDHMMDHQPPQEHQNYHLPLDYADLRGHQDDVSDLMENFPSFTSRMWTESANISSRSEGSLHAENQRLREAVEKERYRRKHCEQQIQRLNVKLLETQQQLAVAVSTDKRKDIMIEQLDKQLAKVVEGWKKRDHEKEEQILELRKAKMQTEEKFLKQREMIEHFEKDMADTVESLRKEKDSSAVTIEKLQTEIDEKERQRAHAVEMLDAEKERSKLMSQEWESVRDNRDHMEKKIQQLQDRLHSEQDDWFKREQELIQKLDHVSESNQKILQQERNKTEEQIKLNKELEEKLTTLQTETKRLEMEMDAASREKESLKVEMGIMEAKFESNHRMLEADLHSQMEKEIAAQIADVHKRMELMEDELRETHKRHITEINQRNKKDLEKQLAKFHEELKTKDDENRKQYQEYEERLQSSRKEISTLKSAKQKLESQRYEILTKLQYMMQSQWNEAVSLLVSTPQRQNLKSQTLTPQLGVTQENKGGVNFKIPSQSAAEGFQSSSPGKDRIRSDGENQTQTDLPREVNMDRNDIEHQFRDLDLTEFNASLHMQQLLQSLTHPIMFPAAQPPGGTSAENMPNHADNPQTNSQNVHHQHQQLLNMDDMQVLEQQMPPSGHSGHLPGGSELTSHEVPKWSHDQSHTIHTNSQNQGSPNRKQNVENWLHHNNVGPILVANSTNQAVGPGHVINSSNQSYGQGHVMNASSQSYGPGHVMNTSNQSYGPSHVMNTSIQSIDGWFPGQSLPQAAVAIRPPQQHGSCDYEAASQRQVYTQPDQSHTTDRLVYSPPTKQTRSQASEEQNQHPGDTSDESLGEISAVIDETMKLNAEYNQIEEKFDKHEFRQSELQHYIQLLLQKPPGEAADDIPIDESASMFSHDQTEDLDLNDTAQAAQLQKDLLRIQQLREKQSVGAKREDGAKGAQPSHHGPDSEATTGPMMPGVLPPEQLADISRLLSQYREHWDTSQQNPDLGQDGEQITELVSILKNLQHRYPQSPREADHLSPKTKKVPVSRISPGSPRSTEIAKVRKNLKVQLAMVSDGPHQKEIHGDRGQPSRSQGQSQPKKAERKVAPSGGGGSKAQNKSKSAWK